MALGKRKAVQQPLFVNTCGLNLRPHPYYEAVNRVLASDLLHENSRPSWRGSSATVQPQWCLYHPHCLSAALFQARGSGLVAEEAVFHLRTLLRGGDQSTSSENASWCSSAGLNEL